LSPFAQLDGLAAGRERTVSLSPALCLAELLLEGDPIENISAIRRIRLVMTEGIVYYPSEIYEATGIKPFADPLRASADPR
jgi:hypothetical protein